MKKIIFLFIIFLSINLVSAVSIDLKSEFKEKETLLGKISGNFIQPPEKNKIYFYKAHVRIPTDIELIKIKGDYYFYTTLLNKESGNYSIKIKDIKYLIGNEVIEEDIVKNFTIINSSAEFSIKPAVVYSKDEFSIQVQNMIDSNIELEIKIPSKEKKETGFLSFFESTEEENKTIVNLKSGETKNIYFKPENITENFYQEINISSENTFYVVPVYIYTLSQEEKIYKKEMQFIPSQLDVLIIKGDNDLQKKVKLKNTGNIVLENISLDISDSLKNYLNLSRKKILELEPNKTKEVLINTTSFKKEEIVEGQIKAKYEQGFDLVYSYVFVSLDYKTDYIPFNETNKTINNSGNKTSGEKSVNEICKDFEGEICEKNYECSGEKRIIKDNTECCIDNCIKIEQSSTKKIIGWLIIIVVILFILWFYFFKYNKTTKSISLLDIAKGKK